MKIQAEVKSAHMRYKVENFVSSLFSPPPPLAQVKAGVHRNLIEILGSLKRD